MRGVLRLLADDLTGACDVAAALLPWPGGVVVVSAGWVDSGRAADATPVRNTQSRTLPVAAAAASVRAALVDVPPGWHGILFKKIDTGLRGNLGAELDAAMDAIGVDEAIIAPAIPEVGRTTEAGMQLIGGVPVHETAFAHDPQNPVRESRVTAVVEATSQHRAGLVPLDVVRRVGGVVEQIEKERSRGARLIVCDAQTDEDLAAVVRGVLGRPRPLLLAGSIGLAGALRRVLAVERGRWVVPAALDVGGRGTLVVVGSAHPTAYTQVEHAVAGGDLSHALEVAPDGAAAAGAEAARAVGAGRSVALLPPARTTTGLDSGVVLTAMRQAALAALDRVRPAGIVLVGGETAFHVLEGLGHPGLQVEARPYPLVVRSRLLGGGFDGLPLVTKGGSSGGVALLQQVLREMRHEVRR